MLSVLLSVREEAIPSRVIAVAALLWPGARTAAEPHPGDGQGRLDGQLDLDDGRATIGLRVSARARGGAARRGPRGRRAGDLAAVRAGEQDAARLGARIPRLLTRRGHPGLR